MPWLTVTPRQANERYMPSDYYIVEYDGYDAVDTANWTIVHRSEITNTTLYRDDRFHKGPPRLIFRDQLDMESLDIGGTSMLERESGQRSLRFDTTTRELRPIRWVVPDTMGSGHFTLSANAAVLQQDDGNFIALVISVIRDGKELTHSYTPSAEQLSTFGQWGDVGVVFRPSFPLLAKDIVQLRAWPLMTSSAMYLDDLELRILQ
jgi:hypothetical protein